MMFHDSIMMSQVHQHRSMMRDASNNEILSHFSFLSARDCSCGAVMGS